MSDVTVEGGEWGKLQKELDGVRWDSEKTTKFMSKHSNKKWKVNKLDPLNIPRYHVCRVYRHKPRNHYCLVGKPCAGLAGCCCFWQQVCVAMA
jgi:hypothetical protein